MSDSSQHIRNMVFFPLRCLFPNNEYIGFLGVTPLSEERFLVVKPYLRGKVLDIGCGDNRLVQEYRCTGGEGFGADLPTIRHADVHLTPGEPLPFSDQSFDTVVMLATLNHIPDRNRVVCECFRCLVPGGRIVITMLGRVVGTLGHFLWRLLRSDADLGHRRASEGELMGMSKAEVYKILTQAGFSNIRHYPFALGLNNLFVAERGRD